ncbi:MAG: SAM-dependent methyltransferase [Nitrospirae bacterium]|nr:SAM-dependent methyltransferase [Nitrospirota bacterium]
MSSLKEKIIERIESEGPINFETFMEMALYYPELGYYTRGALEIGRRGDFYTSPHLHPIFGAMLGRQIREMWRIIGRPDKFEIVEMGAGFGYLAKDMLEYLRQSDAGNLDADENFFQRLKYTIVELNPAVKRREQELLDGFMDKIAFVSDIGCINPINGCFLSNELPDAFPVRLVVKDGDLKEVFVSVKDGDFVEVTAPLSEDVKRCLGDRIALLPDRYRTEVNLKVRDWLNDISPKLLNGFILTIDYGYPADEYYSEERDRGTLLCYHRHRVNENPYQNIGEQDITAHLNFSSLKQWGDELGIKTIGFSSQGTYLVSLGIDEVIKELYGDSMEAVEAAKIKGLILPEGMGESHKVMVQYKGSKYKDTDMPLLKGFALRNHIKRL